ncbi:transcriptional regulator, MarR family protein [Paenibacillus vortex V453]|uniref:Transcriptional regulator n=2 Tax=Paenibacillus TaxID=44249 RepID=A0A163IMY5_9BACL|nr:MULTISPECIES: MarR family transcriptional regulator [Paenibacillus]AWP31045.1 transcriptional regulator [Paenibacillus sp. Cedars]EFU43723.1 transcriptional regulator, MarR family protein [Paenibacillus vortex V453]KZS46040.1 transcriptional regulator [Paenibacillus glucanolyticus]MDH6675319.1 MarR family 2-MHQ and catechol resistance regulon transcriptional repressor [Paenibacillus sp. LBL]
MKQLGFSQENRLAMLSWIRITRFQQVGNQISNEFLQPFCITVAQFDVLIQVMVHQPLSQQELAEYLSISGGGVSHMVKRLEKLGLIVRKQDWKVKYISLTEKGQALLEEIIPLLSDFQTSMFDILDEQELQQLYKTMRKLHQHNLKNKAAQPEFKAEEE